MATTMALSNICTKFKFASRISLCLCKRTSSIKIENAAQNIASVQARCFWESSTTSSSKQVERTLAKDGKPKAPGTVFSMYIQEVKDEFKRYNPNKRILVSELSAFASRKWKNVDPEKKEKMAEQRKTLLEKYKIDMKDYIDNMTPEEIKLEENKKYKKKLKTITMAQRQLGRPKKPGSAFCHYMAEHGSNEFALAQQSQDGKRPTVVMVMAAVQQKWNNLSDAEKEKYIEESARQRELYAADMERWETEMMELGRFDVIRKTTLFKVAGHKIIDKKSK